jgi:hypothetical protein
MNGYVYFASFDPLLATIRMNPAVKPGNHYCFVTQRWDITSSAGGPVIGISECEVCGNKATEADWAVWKERNRWKES